MSAFHSSLTLLCLLTVQGAEKNQPHVDDQGMPLPKGAIARLGTLRLVHPGEVRSLAFSPDGTVIASGVSQGKKVYLGEKTIHQGGALTVGSGVWVTHASIRLWNVANGKLLREMKTPDAPVTALLFDSTGKTLFAGCGKFLCAWNLKTGKKIWQQEGAKGGVYHYGVRVERLLLAKDRLFSIHEGEVYCPVNRNGGFALFHHPQYAVRCWNRRTGKPVSLPESFRSTVKTEGRIPVLFHEIALTPDAHFAAVIVSDAKPGPTFEAKWTYKNRRLQIIETSTGKGIHSIPDQSGAMSHLTFSADGKTLALIHNQELRLLDRVSGNKRILDKKVSDVDRLLIQDDTLTAQRDDRSIQAWDLKSGKRLRSHRFSERDFESARHGKKVGVMFFNTIRLVDLRSGKDLHGFDGHRLTPLIRYSHSEKNILLSRDPETVMRWQTDTGKCSEALSIPGQHSKYWWRYTRNGDMEKEASTEKRWYVKRVKKKLEIRHIKTNRLVRVIDRHCEE